MPTLTRLSLASLLGLCSLSAHAVCTPPDAEAKAAELAAKVHEVTEQDPERAAQIHAELEQMKLQRTSDGVADECAMYEKRLKELEQAGRQAG